MPIRNYTSKIPASQTAGMMQDLLGRHGARRVTLDYEAGSIAAISFVMMVASAPVWFRIAPDPAAMLRAMKRDPDVPSAKCKPQQAERTAWKNKHDWLDAQLAEVAAGQARLEELLLGYVITNDGRTVFERVEESGFLLGGDHPPLLDGGAA